jgi:hypothetical protein
MGNRKFWKHKLHSFGNFFYEDVEDDEIKLGNSTGEEEACQRR